MHEIANVADAEVAVGVEERSALEHAQRADVHRILEPLHVQEAGVERGEPVVSSHRPPMLRSHDGYGLRRMPRVATTVWTISPELVLALDEQLGLPVDSYVNGSQTWLVEDGADHARMAAPPGGRIPAAGRSVARTTSGKTVVAQLSLDRRPARAAGSATRCGR